MKECLNEGALQAYLDGELAEAKRQRAGAHLQSCARCRARLERLEATAARVNALMDDLVTDDLMIEVPVRAPSVVLELRARSALRKRWAVAVGVLSISAMLAMLAITRHPQVAAPAQQAAKQPAVQPSPTVVRPIAAPVAKVRARYSRRLKQLPKLDDFMALDDAGPIQMGVVVRVMLPASAFAAVPQAGAEQVIMADLVIGENGQARAIRFVP